MCAGFTRREALLGVAATALAPARAGAISRKGAIPKALRRGFNLPDQVPLRSGRESDLATLKTLRRMGMTHIRLPVAAEYVLPSFSGPATVSAATDDLARALDRLIALDYAVTVDLHPGADFQELYRRDGKAAQGALLANWPLLARRLSQWPADRICAELLNEPPVSDDVWRPFAEKLVRAVRAELPKAVIVTGPAPWQRPEALAAWAPFADPNIVYAVHYYDPMAFTHQYSTWDKGSVWSRLSEVPFPSEAGDERLLRLAGEAAARGDKEAESALRDMAARTWNAAAIDAQLGTVAAWSEAHDAPVVVNEFGVLRWKARRADRLAWLAAVRASAERCSFGWAHWDYSTGFGLLNEDGALDSGVLQALLPG